MRSKIIYPRSSQSHTNFELLRKNSCALKTKQDFSSDTNKRIFETIITDYLEFLFPIYPCLFVVKNDFVSLYLKGLG